MIHRFGVEKYIIAPAKYHISAAILSLAPDRVPEAVTVFEKEIRPLFEATYATSAPMLALTGLNHFRVCCVLFHLFSFDWELEHLTSPLSQGNVFFAEPETNEETRVLTELCERVQGIFASHDMILGDKTEFVPHMTIMKLSKGPSKISIWKTPFQPCFPAVRHGPLRKLPVEALEQFTATPFGTEVDGCVAPLHFRYNFVSKNR